MWYITQRNHVKSEVFTNWLKTVFFLKKFSSHILAVRRANYSIKRAQDIGLQLILQFHQVK